MRYSAHQYEPRAVTHKAIYLSETSWLLPSSTSSIERSPFTIRIAEDDDSLNSAINIRHAAYARHLPDFARHLETEELSDRMPGTIVLLAEAKIDGTPIGTMRIQTNRFAPLDIEHSVDLPASLRGRPLAEATRLGVSRGPTGSAVKTMLFKAFYLFCVQQRIDTMIISARSPVDRMYEALLFDDLGGEKKYVPMHHVGGLPHRIMKFDVPSAQARWQAARHPLYEFMCNTIHPDLHLARPGTPHRLSRRLAIVGTRGAMRLRSSAPRASIDKVA
jgi:hypothetical protein